ncbi:MAG: polysaccharide export protein [Tardiphaga sp.]|nr:polysaccharide export protein [Tardiphaga sp.]
MSILSACRSSLFAAVSVAALSGMIGDVAHAQARPDLDALVYGAAAPAAAPVPAVPQVVMQQAPQVAPRGLFTSSSAGSSSYSSGALAALGGMFKRTPRAAPQPMDSQAAMTQPYAAPPSAPAQTVTGPTQFSQAQASQSAMPRNNDLDNRAYGAPADPVSPPAQSNQRGLLTGSRSASSSSNGALAALGRGFRPSARGNYALVPARYAPPPMVAVPYDPTYRVDAGDRLRIVVYGQDGLTNTYQISASGSITMPLIGGVPARGRTPAELAGAISARLRDGFIREPSVAVEIEAYRPFFILGEVAAPGQYPYVPHMSVESAIAIAGGFSPRAKRDRVTLTHAMPDGLLRAVVPVGTPLSPGDTILVGERWF